MRRAIFLVLLLLAAPGYAAVDYFFKVDGLYDYEEALPLQPAEDARIRERFAALRIRLQDPSAGGSASYYKDHETERLIEDGMSFSFGDAWGGIFENCAPLVIVEDEWGNPVEVREPPCRFDASLRDFGLGLEGIFTFENEPFYRVDAISYRSEDDGSFVWDIFFNGQGVAPGTSLSLIVVDGTWERIAALSLPGTLSLFALGAVLVLVMSGAGLGQRRRALI